jgi:hypothetical protein
MQTAYISDSPEERMLTQLARYETFCDRMASTFKHARHLHFYQHHAKR